MRTLSAMPAWVSLLYVIPVSLWWYVQFAMLPAPMSPPLAGISLQVLQTLFMAQALCLCLFIPMLDRGQGPLPQLALNGIAMSLLPAWPLLAMFGLASGVSVVALAATEAAVATIGAIVLGIAILMRRSKLGAEGLRLALASLSAVAAALTWFWRTELLQGLAA